MTDSSIIQTASQAFRLPITAVRGLCRSPAAVAMAVLLVVASIGSAGVGIGLAQEPQEPEAAYGDNKAGPLADEMFGIVRYEIPESAQLDDRGHPQVIVTYTNGSHDQLEAWANETEERQIIANDSDDPRAVVAAPRAQLTGDWSLGSYEIGLNELDIDLPGDRTGLSELSFVESWEVNRVVERPEPVQLSGNESYTAPDRLWGDGEFNKHGLAFSEDVNQSSHLEAKQLENATGLSVNGSGFTVAVLDTGLNVRNTTNSSLYQDRLSACKNFVVGTTGCDNVNTSTDHGPWTAAAIAADPDPNVRDEQYEGVAPGADLMVGKVLNDEGKGSLEQVAAGIEWAAKGPDGEYDTGDEADVISLSLGSFQYSPLIAEEIQKALNNGVTAVIVASGNSRMHPTHTRYIGSPADADGVIAVAATNVSLTDSGAPNTSTVGVASFSSPGPDGGVADGSEGVTRGEGPDVAAAGMAVTVPIIDESGYRRNVTLSGTSMAAPEVSGAVMLLLEKDPTLENESARVRSRVTETATPLPQAGVHDVGAGLLDVEGLLANETTNRTQEEVRSDEAAARDTANAAYNAQTDRGLFDISLQADGPPGARVAG